MKHLSNVFSRSEIPSEVAIIGAFDRFNYGDILFPIILSKYIRVNFKTKFSFFGVKSADLTKNGGVKVKPLSELLSPAQGSLVNKTPVILAGGEVLGARWFKISSYLLSHNFRFIIRVIQKFIPESFLDKIASWFLGVSAQLPFVVDRSITDGAIAYNAVGGTSITTLPKELKETALKNLALSNYVSVRDRDSQCALKEKGIYALLAPDSAACLSSLFPKQKLHLLDAKDARVCIEKCKEYCAFQIALPHCRKRADIKSIARQLEGVYRKTGLKIILCPIGLVTGHEDQIALKKIHNAVSSEVEIELFHPNTIYDVLTIIAHARVFAGTSLHGCITAMAYGVPYVGISEMVPKLTAYLETWGVPELAKDYSLSDIEEAIVCALEVPCYKLTENGVQLAQLALENLSQVTKSIQEVYHA